MKRNLDYRACVSSQKYQKILKNCSVSSSSTVVIDNNNKDKTPQDPCNNSVPSISSIAPEKHDLLNRLSHLEGSSSILFPQQTQELSRSQTCSTSSEEFFSCKEVQALSQKKGSAQQRNRRTSSLLRQSAVKKCSNSTTGTVSYRQTNKVGKKNVHSISKGEQLQQPQQVSHSKTKQTFQTVQETFSQISEMSISDEARYQQNKLSRRPCRLTSNKKRLSKIKSFKCKASEHGALSYVQESKAPGKVLLPYAQNEKLSRENQQICSSNWQVFQQKKISLSKATTFQRSCPSSECREQSHGDEVCRSQEKSVPLLLQKQVPQSQVCVSQTEKFHSPSTTRVSQVSNASMIIATSEDELNGAKKDKIRAYDQQGNSRNNNSRMNCDIVIPATGLSDSDCLAEQHLYTELGEKVNRDNIAINNPDMTDVFPPTAVAPSFSSWPDVDNGTMTEDLREATRNLENSLSRLKKQQQLHLLQEQIVFEGDSDSEVTSHNYLHCPENTEQIMEGQALNLLKSNTSSYYKTTTHFLDRSLYWLGLSQQNKSDGLEQTTTAELPQDLCEVLDYSIQTRDDRVAASVDVSTCCPSKSETTPLQHTHLEAVPTPNEPTDLSIQKSVDKSMVIDNNRNLPKYYSSPLLKSKDIVPDVGMCGVLETIDTTEEAQNIIDVDGPVEVDFAFNSIHFQHRKSLRRKSDSHYFSLDVPYFNSHEVAYDLSLPSTRDNSSAMHAQCSQTLASPIINSNSTFNIVDVPQDLSISNCPPPPVSLTEPQLVSECDVNTNLTEISAGVSSINSLSSVASIAAQSSVAFNKPFIPTTELELEVSNEIVDNIDTELTNDIASKIDAITVASSKSSETSKDNKNVIDAPVTKALNKVRTRSNNGRIRNKSYYCEHCDVYFKIKINFLKHKNGHKLHGCRLCSSHFSSFKALSYHSKQVHELILKQKLYPCNKCERTFTKKIHLQAHLLKDHPDGLQCKKCGEEFETEADLEQHATASHVSSVACHQCHICNKSFEKQKHLLRHLNGHKNNVCSVCGFSASSKLLLGKHVRKEHSGASKTKIKNVNRITPSDDCCQSQNKRKVHRNYVKLKSEKYSSSINHVSDRFINNYKKISEEQLLDGRSNECREHAAADKSFVQTEKLHNKVESLQHQTAESTEHHVCHLCGRHFSQAFILRAHLTAAHSDKNEFKCLHCIKKFSSKQSLDKHLASKIHKESQERLSQKKYKQICKNVTDIKLVEGADDQLTETVRRSNGVEVSNVTDGYTSLEHETVQCTSLKVLEISNDKIEKVDNNNLMHSSSTEEATEVVKQKQSLKITLNKITNDVKSLPNVASAMSHAPSGSVNSNKIASHCKERQGKSHNKVMSKRHRKMRSRGTVTEYSCDMCEFKTHHRTSLWNHKQCHKSGKRFICELCGKRVNSLPALKEHHVFLHSEECNFPCSKCPKKFKNKSSLDRHTREHSSLRPHSCNTCGVSYKRRSHLTRHLRSCHNESPKVRTVVKVLPNNPKTCSDKQESKNNGIKKDLNCNEASSTSKSNESNVSTFACESKKVAMTNNLVLLPHNSILVPETNVSTPSVIPLNSHSAQLSSKSLVKFVPSTITSSKLASEPHIKLVYAVPAAQSTTEVHYLIRSTPSDRYMHLL